MPGHTACLAHISDAQRATYLAGLAPGDTIDHRGTSFTEQLLSDLLDAFRDPATMEVRLGSAIFESVTFEGDARFDSATFEGAADFGAVTFKGACNFASATFEARAGFESATFKGDAGFESATFKGDAGFESATFRRDAWFESATFRRDANFTSATFEGHALFASSTFESRARFGSATFEGHALFASSTFESHAEFGSSTFDGDAWFESATIEGSGWYESATFRRDAWFESATFRRDAWFESATFRRDAWFESAAFNGAAWFESVTIDGDACFALATFTNADRFGPLVCAGQVKLSGATFGSPVTLSVVARHLVCRRTRWSSTAEIQLRYATLDFAHAVFEYPLTIAAESDPFLLTDGRQLVEAAFAAAPGPGVRVASLRGVDAAHLVLSDLDLAGCLFVGTVHLDQLRLEGACTFDTAPPGVHWRRRLPVRFTERRILAEEHHWRAGRAGAVQGWNVEVVGAGRAGPIQLAPVYRALRKSFEDSKHEPGAADFYYGEMEMRRHAGDIPRSERGLLTAYWALSGYGLRASRALAWLGAAMLLTIVLLMVFGLARDTPKQTATGTVPAGGGKVTFEIDKDDPANPTGPWFTGERFEKALGVTLNSVVFRSSGQDLTTAGTYIEMASRLTEPVLLGLAVLAIRNRVKR
ncbi:pentapeptide repeat-containing protein [Streptomyces cyaneofuscatus]